MKWHAYLQLSGAEARAAGRDRDNALYSSWFGPKAATKAQALKRAIQVAEALK